MMAYSFVVFSPIFTFDGISLSLMKKHFRRTYARTHTDREKFSR
jgi:hypothetical protein